MLFGLSAETMYVSALERAFARLMAKYALFQTSRPYEIVRRQGDYARRLDAIAAQRGQE